MTARVVRIGLLVTGILVVSGASVTMLVQPRTIAEAAPATFGQVHWAIAILIGVAAAMLVATGGAAWFARPQSVLAIVAVWAAAAWLASELLGSPAVPREFRSAARVLVPLVTPLLAHTAVIAFLGDRLGRITRVWLAACYVGSGILAVGHAVTWDPYRVLVCPLGVCSPGDNVVLLRADIGLSERFLAAWAGLTLIAGALLAVKMGIGLARRSRTGRAEQVIGIAALATGLAMAWWAYGRLRGDGSPTVDLNQLPTIAVLSLTVAALGIATTLSLILEVRRASQLRELAETIGAEASPRTLEQVLVATLGDPTVRVAYPLDSGEVVDVAGRRVSLPSGSPGRSLATIERGGRTVAIVEHSATVDAGPLAREIGTAARLAVENERLDATVHARLRELQESRARIVAAGDATRIRIERDLHDGAQQRLLAVSYELRLARATMKDPNSKQASRLDEAIERLDEALIELRELAHGIHPAVLTEAGLDAAIRALAETSPLPIELDAHEGVRCTSPSELAAYLAVVEAVERATAVGAARIDVALRKDSDMLRVEIEYAADSEHEGWERIEDRVGAAGGRASITAGASEMRLRLDLPCA